MEGNTFFSLLLTVGVSKKTFSKFAKSVNQMWNEKLMCPDTFEYCLLFFFYLFTFNVSLFI